MDRHRFCSRHKHWALGVASRCTDPRDAWVKCSSEHTLDQRRIAEVPSKAVELFFLSVTSLQARRPDHPIQSGAARNKTCGLQLAEELAPCAIHLTKRADAQETVPAVVCLSRATPASAATSTWSYPPSSARLDLTAASSNPTVISCHHCKMIGMCCGREFPLGSIGICLLPKRRIER